MADGSIKYEVTVDSSGLTSFKKVGTDAFSAVDKQAEKANTSIGSVGKTLAGMAGAYITFQALGRATNYAYGEFKEAERAAINLNQAVKVAGLAGTGTAERFEALSQSLMNVTGVDDDAIKGAMALSLRLTHNADAAEQLTKMALDTAAGLQAVGGEAVPLADVTKALSMAFEGNTKGLKSLGILLTDHEKKTMESGTAAERLALLTSKVNEQFAGAAQENIKSFSAQVGLLQNNFGNISAELFKQVIPGLQGMVTEMNNVMAAKAKMDARNATPFGKESNAYAEYMKAAKAVEDYNKAQDNFLTKEGPDRALAHRLELTKKLNEAQNEWKRLQQDRINAPEAKEPPKPPKPLDMGGGGGGGGGGKQDPWLAMIAGGGMSKEMYEAQSAQIDTAKKLYEIGLEEAQLRANEMREERELSRIENDKYKQEMKAMNQLDKDKLRAYHQEKAALGQVLGVQKALQASMSAMSEGLAQTLVKGTFDWQQAFQGVLMQIVAMTIEMAALYAIVLALNAIPGGSAVLTLLGLAAQAGQMVKSGLVGKGGGAQESAENSGMEFHNGGKVPPRYHSGWNLRSDERMAILQTGEGVLQRSAMQRIGDDGFNRLNNGQGGGGTTNIIIHGVPTSNAQKTAEAVGRVFRQEKKRGRRIG